MDIQQVAENPGLIEIGRKAVEDIAIDHRDSRISFMPCGNGIVCREPDGQDSAIIRIPTRDAIRIAIKAIAEHVNNTTKGGDA